MKLKGIMAEDFINYKTPSLFLITSICDWKCCTELGLDVSICQNNQIATSPIEDISPEVIYQTYVTNDITKSIVFGGLEPFKQYDEMIEVISYFREHNINDPIIIYTGYYKEEISDKIEWLKKYPNIIIKFGRFVPDKPMKYDDVLGITLASDNQYAEAIS